MPYPVIAGNTLGELSRNSLIGTDQDYRAQDAAANRAMLMYQYNNLGAADKARFNELAADRVQRGDIALSPWTRGQTDEQARRNSIIEKGLENQLALGMEQYNRATKGQELGHQLGMARIGTDKDIALAPWELGMTEAQGADYGLRFGDQILNNQFRNQVLDRETVFRNEAEKRRTFEAMEPYNKNTKYQDDLLKQANEAMGWQILSGALSSDRFNADDELALAEMNKQAQADAAAANARREQLANQWTTSDAEAIATTQGEFNGRALWDPVTKSFKALPPRTKPRTNLDRLMPFIQKMVPGLGGGTNTTPSELHFRRGPNGWEMVPGAAAANPGAGAAGGNMAVPGSTAATLPTQVPGQVPGLGGNALAAPPATAAGPPVERGIMSMVGDEAVNRLREIRDRILRIGGLGLLRAVFPEAQWQQGEAPPEP